MNNEKFFKMRKVLFLIIVLNSFTLYSQEFKYNYRIQLSHDYFISCEEGDQNIQDTTIIEVIYNNGEEYGNPIFYQSIDMDRPISLYPVRSLIVLDSSKYKLESYRLSLMIYYKPTIYIDKYCSRIRIVFGPNFNTKIVKSVRPISDKELDEIRESLKMGETPDLMQKGVIQILTEI